MIIRSATYIKSCTDIKDCPVTNLPEYAFVGRSNVGKSSLINMLVNRKDLALTSSKPGKTKTLNHFLINEKWYLVDLPGLGFAHVSHRQREEWTKMMNEYLSKRDNLMCVFVLIDARIPLQEIDMNFMVYLGENGIPFVAVSTKSDKVKVFKLQKHLGEIQSFFDMYWEERPQHIVSSVPEKKGRDEILKLIDETNKAYFLKK
jgi:GTP-binding protein